MALRSFPTCESWEQSVTLTLETGLGRESMSMLVLFSGQVLVRQK